LISNWPFKQFFAQQSSKELKENIQKIGKHIAIEWGKEVGQSWVVLTVPPWPTIL